MPLGWPASIYQYILGETMKDENKASARGSDNRKGHQPESVQNVERVGSKGAGVSFPVHNHPDKSVVTKGNLKQ